MLFHKKKLAVYDFLKECRTVDWEKSKYFYMVKFNLSKNIL